MKKAHNAVLGGIQKERKKEIKQGQHIKVVACKSAIIALLINAYAILSLEFLNAHLNQCLKDVIHEYGLGSHCIYI